MADHPYFSDLEITPEMLSAAYEFAAIALDSYPISDASIQLLVEGVLNRAIAARKCPKLPERTK